MTWRIGELVEFGELLNTRKNTVHGWLKFRGREQLVLLQLTGNCESDLAGRHLRFVVPPQRSDSHGGFDLRKFAMQQVGPTGRMTAVAPSKPQENGGGPDLPTPALFLEWFSQNGRVVLELQNAEIEFVDDESDDLEMSDDDADALFFEVCDQPDDHDADYDTWSDDGALDAPERDDPFGLFPEDLQSQLDSEFGDTGETGDFPDLDESELTDEDRELLKQSRLLEELIAAGESVPIATIFDPPLKLLPGYKLDDDSVERALKRVLARLARHGIALDMCEHYTPRDAYRLLLDTILKEEGTYPELSPTCYVQHFMTHEHCEHCDAECAAEFADDDGWDDDEDDDTYF